jgi:hypothetical protein
MGLFTAFRALPLLHKAIALFVALGLLWVGAQVVNHFVDRAFQGAEESGASRVEAKAATSALEAVEKGNAAAETVARDPAVRRADCLRDSRTPENC